MGKPRGPERVSQGRRTEWRQRFAAVPHRYALMVAYWFMVAATLVFSVAYGWHSWQRYKESGLDRLMLTTALIATGTHQSLDREASGLQFLARRLRAIHALRHPARARRVLREYQKVSPEIASADLIAPDGRVVASTAVSQGQPLPDFRKAPDIWPGLHRALLRPGLHLHRPLHGPLIGHWVIGFSDTVMGPRGNVCFLVTTPIRFRNFEDLFAQLPLPRGLAVGVIRNDYYLEGRQPVPHGDLSALLDRPQNGILAQTLMRHPDAPDGVFGGWVSTDREYRYGAFVRVAGYPLIAFADVPRAMWVAGWWRRQAEIPLIFLVAALAFSGFAYRQVQMLAVRSEAEAARRAELLRALVTHDPLTGLLNRKGLYPVLRRAMARARRDVRVMAVGFLDVDDFKGINDRYGHGAGDAVLKELARRLERALRGTDHVARMGGDEFVLLIEGLRRRTDLMPIIAHLKERLAVPFVVDHHRVPVRVSLGVAFFPFDAADAERLIDLADQAMYVAKARAEGDEAAWARLYDRDVAAGPGPEVGGVPDDRPGRR